VNNHADAWTPPVKPRVYVISRPRFDVRAVLAFLQQEATKWHRTSLTGEPEEIVEIAGRVCYMSFGNNQSPRSNKEYIRNLIRQGHESVLEHVSWTFILTGVSRAFTHQLVRHRVGFSFSQLSQQYHEETSAAFVEPAHLRRSRRALKAWREAVAVSQESYRVILTSLSEVAADTSGQALSKKEFNRAIRSAARSVLPNATETKIVVTANARALRHFFKIRGAIPGDVEMREVAAELFRRVRKEAPQLFRDFALQRLPDGTSTLAYSGE
jgi:thymidylate synthase (FAD)